MITRDVCNAIKLISNDKIIKSSAILVTVFVVFVGIFVSYISAIFTYICYILGYVTAWFLIKYPKKVTEGIQRLLSLYGGGISINKSLKHSCSICDDLSCNRHQLNVTIAPWKHIHITKELNESLEKFYNRIIENFICSWYGQFTDDLDFLHELRFSLRYASAMVINRLLEIDVAGLITNKLIPCTVKHIDDYMYIQQIKNLKNVRFKEVAIECLGKKLHIAATNRRNELAYLQHLVTSILSNILPESYLKCSNYSVMIREILVGWVFLPLMDVLADPNIINYLVILASTYKSKKTNKINTNTEMVIFLENFAAVDKKISPFSTNLNKIKINTDLLYSFMQFLKKQEQVHLLQFCLDVDDFNTKLITPNLSKKQLEELHCDAIKLYKDYLNMDSLNFTGCPDEIREDFCRLINESYNTEKLTKIPKLLYRAYDYTFNELETEWLPPFFHSNEFYSYICGSKIVANYVKPSRARKYEPISQGTVSKISSGLVKIKGALKTNQPIEGALFPIELQNIEDGTMEDLLLAECKTLFRDLSTWKVAIRSYQASPSNKVIYFCVSVERLDILVDDIRRSWVVLRKDQDFYTLKAKLIEFHGETEICDSPLPSRKAGSSIDVRMMKYEDFLKKLLKKPTLRGSDLLHSFLTTEEDFAIFIATCAPNIQDFGNIYQSVAHKLRKEKGQHLDSFMNAFLSSTGRSRQGKPDWAEVGEEFDALGNCNNKVNFPKTYRNHIFNDNFGVQYKLLKETMSGSFNPEGFVESVFYLLKYIFCIPNGLLKIYVSLCCIAHQIFDFFCHLLIERKLKSNLSHSNLAFLIHLLEDVIFNTRNSPSKEELEKRRNQAFNELEKLIPTFVSKIFGPGLQKGAKTLLEIMQNPHYNKQLVYNLLDIILLEMYPDIEKDLEK